MASARPSCLLRRGLLEGGASPTSARPHCTTLVPKSISWPRVFEALPAWACQHPNRRLCRLSTAQGFCGLAHGPEDITL